MYSQSIKFLLGKNKGAASSRRKEWSLTVTNSESEGAGETTRGPGQGRGPGPETACRTADSALGRERNAEVQEEAGGQLRSSTL